MKTILQILGVIVIGFGLYWFLIVVPQRNECVAKAQTIYSQATTNAQEGLIDSNTYKQAQVIFEAQTSDCYK